MKKGSYVWCLGVKENRDMMIEELNNPAKKKLITPKFLKDLEQAKDDYNKYCVPTQNNASTLENIVESNQQKKEDEDADKKEKEKQEETVNKKQDKNLDFDD